MLSQSRGFLTSSLAGGLHIAAGKILIEVELDTSQSARRLRKDIADIYGHGSDLAVLSSSGLRKGSRYVVRVIEAGDALARQTGLVDANGRPVRGLPPQVVQLQSVIQRLHGAEHLLHMVPSLNQGALLHLKLHVQDPRPHWR